MLEAIILHELGQLEAGLQNAGTGDSVDDIVDLASDDPKVQLDEKLYLKTGNLLKIADVENYAGSSFETDYTLPIPLEVVHPASGYSSNQDFSYSVDSRGTIWEIYYRVSYSGIRYSTDEYKTRQPLGWSTTGSCVGCVLAGDTLVILTIDGRIYFNETPTNPLTWKLSTVYFNDVSSEVDIATYRVLYFTSTEIITMFGVYGNFYTFKLSDIKYATAAKLINSTRYNGETSYYYRAIGTVHPDGRRGFVCTTTGLGCYTDNGGQTWTTKSTNLSPVVTYRKIYFIGNLLVTMPYENTLMVSGDNGASFTEQKPDSSSKFLKYLRPIDENYIFKLWRIQPSSGPSVYRWEIVPNSSYWMSAGTDLVTPPYNDYRSGAFEVDEMFKISQSRVILLTPEISVSTEYSYGRSFIKFLVNSIGIKAAGPYKYLRVK